MDVEFGTQARTGTLMANSGTLAVSGSCVVM
jgi:hypothetical protein